MIDYLAIGLIVLLNLDCGASYYKIKSVYDTARYLDVQDNGHGVRFRTSRGNDRQKWTINDKSGDYVEFVNQGSNLDSVCCDGNFVNTCSILTCWCNCDKAKYLSGHNTAINLYEQTNDDDEEWEFESVSGENYYRIKRKGSSNGYLYITNDNNAKRGSSRSDTKDKFYLLQDGSSTPTTYSYDAKSVFGEFINDDNHIFDHDNIILSGNTLIILSVLASSIITLLITCLCYQCYQCYYQQRKQKENYEKVYYIDSHDSDKK